MTRVEQGLAPVTDLTERLNQRRDREDIARILASLNEGVMPSAEFFANVEVTGEEIPDDAS